jgi:hypothetical protein
VRFNGENAFSPREVIEGLDRDILTIYPTLCPNIVGALTAYANQQNGFSTANSANVLFVTSRLQNRFRSLRS